MLSLTGVIMGSLMSKQAPLCRMSTLLFRWAFRCRAVHFGVRRSTQLSKCSFCCPSARSAVQVLVLMSNAHSAVQRRNYASNCLFSCLNDHCVSNRLAGCLTAGFGVRRSTQLSKCLFRCLMLILVSKCSFGCPHVRFGVEHPNRINTCYRVLMSGNNTLNPRFP